MSRTTWNTTEYEAASYFLYQATQVSVFPKLFSVYSTLHCTHLLLVHAFLTDIPTNKGASKEYTGERYIYDSVMSKTSGTEAVV